MKALDGSMAGDLKSYRGWRPTRGRKRTRCARDKTSCIMAKAHKNSYGKMQGGKVEINRKAKKCRGVELRRLVGSWGR
jgi:hypothetical protein